MCGIAGIITKGRKADETALGKAISCLHHRGPEEDGIWTSTNGQAALAHKRLSILDLSAAASQPMRLRDRYTIVHNGEIYNYLELRNELQKRGCRFQSSSDTEVILYAYEQWGRQCLEKLDGMFAFAIWDQKENKLFVARDRMGEKPFYYALTDEGFHFASEMKGLWGMGIPKVVNQALLYNFLTIGYTSNPLNASESFYEGIYQLPPASYLEYDAANNSIETGQYWQVYLDSPKQINEQDAFEEFSSLLKESVRLRLRSDVPTGSSLSGGLDSSSIVALCQEIPSDQYSHTCFTAGFPGYERDETHYAQAVAKQFGLKHYLVTIEEEEVTDLMEKVSAIQEVPFSSASPLMQFKVYETAKANGIKVLLDGQGADEQLAGYRKYYRWYWQELYSMGKLASSKELALARKLGIIEGFGWKEKIFSLSPHFFSSLIQGRKLKQAFHSRDLNREFASAYKHTLNYTLPVEMSLNGILHHNSFVQGLDELLRLADHNSMGNSLELRLPFLSHQLVEFLFSLPASFKIREGWTKWLLRKTMENKLPTEIVWRKDKTGFEPPQKKWMETKAVKESILHAKEFLASKGILSKEAAKKYRPHNAYEAGNSDWKYWSAAMLY